MKKFESGKRYKDGEATMEVVSRTNKFATIALVHHAGRSNEKLSGTKRVKINDWETEEVVFLNCYEFHA